MSMEDHLSLGYEYHHLGIPTDQSREGERYSSTFKMYITNGNNPCRIQWLRFEADSPLPDLVKTQPHVAFKVKSIDEAIKDKRVLLEPYYPFEKFRVDIVEIDGTPVEFIETSLTEEEIWDTSHHGSLIYPEE